MSRQLSDLTPRSPGDLEEPIVALASAAGPGARAIIRLSGFGVWPRFRQCLGDAAGLPATMTRGRWLVQVRLSALNRTLPATILLWPGPRSYTGQDLVELHTLSSPPLLDLLLADLQHCGARLARPGEFTLRAFLHGKLDLTQAEAVREVIEADRPEELNAALRQLAGGVAQPLHELRDRLLGVLADVEAGLDFAEEDLTFLARDHLLAELREARGRLEKLAGQLEERGMSGQAYRVVLAGKPNVGKSSLFNVLIGRPAALVSPVPGTTRDYVSERVIWRGVEIELIDTAGNESVSGDSKSVGAQSQVVRSEQISQADLVLYCVNCWEDACVEVPSEALCVGTKADLLQGRQVDPTWVCTSARTEEGISRLRGLIADRLSFRPRRNVLEASLARCRNHVQTCLERLVQAEKLAAESGPPELLALELRLALEQLGEMAGTVYSEDLLDRIFSQFCIGK